MASIYDELLGGADFSVIGEEKYKKRKNVSEEERALSKIAKDEANEDLHHALSKYLLSRTEGHHGPRLTVYELCKEHTKTSRTTMSRYSVVIAALSSFHSSFTMATLMLSGE